LRPQQPGDVLSEFVQLGPRRGVHLQVESDREKRSFSAGETSTKTFDLLERGAQVVVDRPSIRRVVAQGAP
jgi:hypothetical protein